jgi:Protein of unknown function (DUF3616)
MKRIFLAPGLVAALVLSLTSCDERASRPDVEVRASAASIGWSIGKLPQRWSLSGFQEDKDLSGIAAWDATNCMVCSDELRVIQTGRMDRNGGTVVAGRAISLLPGKGGKTEVDAEGVAVSREDACYYVTGSHGVGKKKGDFQQSRCNVVRIPVDPATGEPDAAGVRTVSLTPWVQGNPELAGSLGQSLQTNGFNIEGLAWKGGKLWFGVRSPNVNGDAFVIEADSKKLFSGPPEAQLHRLTVGPGLGIREIAALREGFLIVAGEALSDVGKDDAFYLFLWKPGAAPLQIGGLPSPSGKAEGLFILEEADRYVDILVIFDGEARGGPKAYRITKS